MPTGAAYPHDVDFLLVLAFAIDMAGNFANLYGTIVWCVFCHGTRAEGARIARPAAVCA